MTMVPFSSVMCLFQVFQKSLTTFLIFRLRKYNLIDNVYINCCRNYEVPWYRSNGNFDRYKWDIEFQGVCSTYRYLLTDESCHYYCIV